MNSTPQFLALKVEYFGPTNTRGSRVKATCKRLGKSKMFAYDYSARSTYEQIEAALDVSGVECACLLDMVGHTILVIDWKYREELEKFLGAKK